MTWWSFCSITTRRLFFVGLFIWHIRFAVVRIIVAIFVCFSYHYLCEGFREECAQSAVKLQLTTFFPGNGSELTSLQWYSPHLNLRTRYVFRLLQRNLQNNCGCHQNEWFKCSGSYLAFFALKENYLFPLQNDTKRDICFDPQFLPVQHINLHR